LIISKSLLASSDRASNLIRAVYTEPNVDIHSSVDFNFLFSSLPPPFLQFVPPLTARKEKRNAIRKPDKGGPRIFCKTEEISDGAARRILSWSRRPRQRIPGLGHPVYRYVPVLYLRRSHIWIGAHHIPPYLSTYPLPLCIDTSYTGGISRTCIYIISREISNGRRLERRCYAVGCPIARLECAPDYRSRQYHLYEIPIVTILYDLQLTI